MLKELNWIKKNSNTKTKCLSLDKKSMRVTNSISSLTPYRKKWTIWFSNTKWLVSPGITWVFNSLTRMMNSVFFMKRAISRRIFSRLESRQFGRKKKRSGWSIWNSKRDRDRLMLSGSRSLKFQFLLNLLLSLRISLINREKLLITFLLSLKILRSTPWRRSLVVKMLTLKRCRQRFKSWKKDLTTRRNLFSKKSLFTKKSPTWQKNFVPKP